MNHEIVKGLIFSIFEQEGPVPVVCIPDDLDEMQKMTVAMKSISLLMGDQTYQEGKTIDSIKYFGILPFPDYELTSLTYFFLIKDENARGKAKASTISLLINDEKASFIYEHMKDLSVFFAEIADFITVSLTNDEIKEYMNQLLDEIRDYIVKVKAPMRKGRFLKILFTGLDASGKTSFLRAIKQKYSELTGIKPTKGVERSEEQILGQNILEWDIGGQLKYRNNFLKQADLYLYDTNLLNFLIDIRDPARYPEALDFFEKILSIFRSFNQRPPIIICLHKFDPDLENNELILNRINELKAKFRKRANGFTISFFNTSIFNQYSLNKAFSAGITAMSPNREILRSQLEWLAQEIHAQAVLLINQNNIILSDYSINQQSGQVSELSAPHFRNLYKTFSDFKLLKRNSAIWQMDEDMISFNKLEVENNTVYLSILIENEKQILDKLNLRIPEFQDRILPLMQTYL